MPETTDAGAGAAGAAGAAKRVLVVEDEIAIAMLLEDMLADLGYEPVGPVGRLAAATALLDRVAIDAAVVDVNVAGEPVYPLVEVLAARDIAFVFSTGYGSGGIAEAWRDRPVVPKPFTQAELGRALEEALSTVRPAARPLTGV